MESGLRWESRPLARLACSLILAVWRSKNPIILNHIKLTDHGLVFSFMFICVINAADECGPRHSRVRLAGAGLFQIWAFHNPPTGPFPHLGTQKSGTAFCAGECNRGKTSARLLFVREGGGLWSSLYRV